MDFYTILREAHSGWRWLVLVAVLLTTVKVIIGWGLSHNWAKLDTNLIRITNFALSIQVLLGIILYILFLFQGRADVGAFTGAHVIPAFLALAGVGFASARSRKVKKSQKKFMFASLGMIFTVLMIYGALVRVGGLFA